MGFKLCSAGVLVNGQQNATIIFRRPPVSGQSAYSSVAAVFLSAASNYNPSSFNSTRLAAAYASDDEVLVCNLCMPCQDGIDACRITITLADSSTQTFLIPVGPAQKMKLLSVGTFADPVSGSRTAVVSFVTKADCSPNSITTSPTITATAIGNAATITNVSHTQLGSSPAFVHTYNVVISSSLDPVASRLAVEFEALFCCGKSKITVPLGAGAASPTIANRIGPTPVDPDTTAPAQPIYGSYFWDYIGNIVW